MYMFQQNKIKTFGNRTIPMFLKRMFFYIDMDVIPTQNESSSIQTRTFETMEIVSDSHHKDLIEIDLLIKLCDQNRLLQEKTKEIEILQNRLADYEEEIYQKEYKNQIEKQAKFSEGKIYDD